MDLTAKKCVPCEEGTKPFSREEAKKYLGEVSGWETEETENGLKIVKRFTFDSYKEGIDFVNRIADVADAEDHHPDLYVGYKKVTVNLMTHNIGGLSENDFILASKIDKIKE